MKKNTIKLFAASSLVIGLIAAGTTGLIAQKMDMQQKMEVQQLAQLQIQEESARIVAERKAEELAALNLRVQAEMKEQDDRREKEEQKKIEAEANSKPKDTITKNEDGSVEIKPEYSKPEPPAPPTIPEDQKKDPTSKPEYKPEDTKPEPPKTNKPKDGDINSKGQMYIDGFGWIEPVTENKSEVAENAGKGEIIGH